MTQPTYNVDDLAILTPHAAARLADPDLAPGRFHLVRVVADRGATFDYEHVESGPLALIEALSILLAGETRRVWASGLPGKIHR